MAERDVNIDVKLTRIRFLIIPISFLLCNWKIICNWWIVNAGWRKVSMHRDKSKLLKSLEFFPSRSRLIYICRMFFHCYEFRLSVLIPALSRISLKCSICGRTRLAEYMGKYCCKSSGVPS